MGGEIQFTVVTLLLAMAVYFLVVWKNHMRGDNMPSYSSPVRTRYADSNPDLQGYSAAKQGRAFSNEGGGGRGYEGFQDEGKRRIPVRPLGVVDPAQSLARMQKDQADSELRELAAIKQKQSAAAVSLLPNQLDSSVADLTNRNLLISSGPQSGIDVRGAALRNSSHDIRSQPVVKRVPVSIWQNSNLDPPMYQRPLE